MISHVIDNYFPEKRNGTVVEAGTAEGHHMPSTYMEQKLGWKFIGFEIDPRYWPILLQNRPNGLNINLALSDTNEFVDFEVSAWGGNSSLEHSKEHKEELTSYKRTFDNGMFFQKIKVSTITWKHFIKSYRIAYVDFLVLDVEGHELKVLEGMKDCDVIPDVMQIEFPRCDYNQVLLNKQTGEDFSGFAILKHKVEEMGYQFDYVNDANAYFSKKEFWKDKNMPKSWAGEDEEYSWYGYKRYDKNKCKNI